jgi:hypothetical protein
VFCKGRKGRREGGRERERERKENVLKNISCRGILQIRLKELYRWKSIPPSAKLVTARWLWLSLFCNQNIFPSIFFYVHEVGIRSLVMLRFVRACGHCYSGAWLWPLSYISRTISKPIFNKQNQKKHLIACKWIARTLKKLICESWRQTHARKQREKEVEREKEREQVLEKKREKWREIEREREREIDRARRRV